MSSAILDIDVDYPTSELIRPVSDEERAAYARDGAAIVKGVIPLDWVDYMRDAVTRILEQSDPSSQNYADDGDPRFFSLTFRGCSTTRSRRGRSTARSSTSPGR